MVIDDNGVQTFSVKLTCGPNASEGRLPLDEYLTILAGAKTEADIRREFWMRARIVEFKHGRLQTRFR